MKKQPSEGEREAAKRPNYPRPAEDRLNDPYHLSARERRARRRDAPSRRIPATTSPNVRGSGTLPASEPRTEIDCGIRSPEASWPVDPNSGISNPSEASLTGFAKRSASENGAYQLGSVPKVVPGAA